MSSLHDKEFKLELFFPYLTRVFYSHVTRTVSRIYGEQYAMKPHEWRTMAILGVRESLTPAQIMERSSMDKVSVSRAITGLRKRGWILERTNKNDGRSRVLRLSSTGRKVYDNLVPQMIRLEKRLLEDLSPEEVNVLTGLMKRVQEAAKRVPQSDERET